MHRNKEDPTNKPTPPTSPDEITRLVASMILLHITVRKVPVGGIVGCSFGGGLSGLLRLCEDVMSAYFPVLTHET
jgi:hypothetical protein